MVYQILSICNVLGYHKEWLLDSVLDIACAHIEAGFHLIKLLIVVLFLWEILFLAKLLGLGPSKIKMFDGSIRTLRKIKHVLELRIINFFGKFGLWRL